MGNTQMIAEQATHESGAAMVDLKLEVVVIPVSDVDRAKSFYQGLGWRLDADFPLGDDRRVVQMTPPGSPSSIHFGKGITPAAPGSVQGTYLVVDDIDSAREELTRRGASVSDVFHFDGNFRPSAGKDPQGDSYRSFATFSDPDGNGWLLQEIKTRLPGRGLSSDVVTLTDLLRETETRHGEYEPTAPKHHWSGWYAAYIVARQRGKTADTAANEAASFIESSRQ
jgi:catechol 2,3-dioxygenase-like lactoylglutathione lyase family enzyme